MWLHWRGRLIEHAVKQNSSDFALSQEKCKNGKSERCSWFVESKGLKHDAAVSGRGDEGWLCPNNHHCYLAIYFLCVEIHYVHCNILLMISYLCSSFSTALHFHIHWYTLCGQWHTCRGLPVSQQFEQKLHNSYDMLHYGIESSV